MNHIEFKNRLGSSEMILGHIEARAEYLRKTFSAFLDSSYLHGGVDENTLPIKVLGGNWVRIQSVLMDMQRDINNLLANNTLFIETSQTND